jgi:hypothetical protein
MCHERVYVNHSKQNGDDKHYEKAEKKNGPETQERNSKQEDYNVTHQNSWYIALSPFTSGAEFSRCFLNFEDWLMQMMEPQ